MAPDQNRPDDTGARIYGDEDPKARMHDEERPPQEAFERNPRLQEYWRRNITLILSLLAVWALVSYGFAILLANPLSAIRIGQIRLSFWFAQQGSIIIFVLLIIIYAVLMDRLDNEYDVHE